MLFHVLEQYIRSQFGCEFAVNRSLFMSLYCVIVFLAFYRMKAEFPTINWECLTFVVQADLKGKFLADFIVFYHLLLEFECMIFNFAIEATHVNNVEALVKERQRADPFFLIYFP